jgi:hypothetical protein
MVVYCGVHAGLGNQLFMYAAGVLVSKVHNCPLYIQNCTTNVHNKKQHNYVQRLFLDASECQTIPQEVYDLNQPVGPLYPWNPLEAKLPCRIRGYFQYYPILKPILPYLIERLCQALHVRERTDSMFLHIRRGDYLEKPEIHYNLQSQYYISAYLKVLEMRNGSVPYRCLIFSDDIQWSKQQVWIQQIANVEFYENEDEIESLAEMARCYGGAVIANSTFSWWGALLSKSPYVVYPSQWSAFANFIDLFPQNWLKN